MLEQLTEDEQRVSVLLLFVALHALAGRNRTAYNFAGRVRELMDDGSTMTPEKFELYQMKLKAILYELKELHP